jgi:hypothetical protein
LLGQIAVDDPARVCGLERLRDADPEHRRAAPIERRVRFERAREARAFEPFHREPRLAVVGRAVRDVRDDRGMIEAREDVALDRESIRATAFGQHLERDEPPALAIARAIDGAHAARAGLHEDLEAVADHLGRAVDEAAELSIARISHSSTPRTARASARYSSSLTVIARENIPPAAPPTPSRVESCTTRALEWGPVTESLDQLGLSALADRSGLAPDAQSCA